MIADSAPKILVDIRTPKGTAIQALVVETPVYVLLRTPQVSCQVIVAAEQGKARRELVGWRDV